MFSFVILNFTRNAAVWDFAVLSQLISHLFLCFLRIFFLGESDVMTHGRNTFWRQLPSNVVSISKQNKIRSVDRIVCNIICYNGKYMFFRVTVI